MGAALRRAHARLARGSRPLTGLAHLAAAVLRPDAVDGGRPHRGRASLLPAARARLPVGSTSCAYWARPVGAREVDGLPRHGGHRWSRSSPGSCSPSRRSGARASPTPGTASTSSRPSRSSPSPLPHVAGDRACATRRGRRLKLGLDALRAASSADAAAGRRRLRSCCSPPVALLWLVYPGERMHRRVPARTTRSPTAPSGPFAPSLATTDDRRRLRRARARRLRVLRDRGLPRADHAPSGG